MEALNLKGIGQNLCQASRHVALTVVWSKRIVAKIAGAKAASDDFADVNDSSQLAPFRNNPVAPLILNASALEIGIELIRSLWRRCPTAVQFSAPSDGSQKFVTPPD